MNLLHVGRYVRDPRVATWKKLLGVFAVAYVVMPVDLVPDVVPLLGWLDDVGVVAMVLGFLARDMAKLPPAAPRTVPSQVVG